MNIQDRKVVFQVIDNIMDGWGFTCNRFAEQDQRMRKWWATFWNQPDGGYWPLSPNHDDKKQERLLMLATFLVLEGEIPDPPRKRRR